MPQPKPFKQGKLDGFCSVYALINAIDYCVLRSKRPWKKKHRYLECEKIFQKTILIFLRKRLSFHDGIEHSQFKRLIPPLIKYIKENHRRTVEILPLYKGKSSTRTLDDCWAAMHAHLGKPASAIVIGTTSKDKVYDHWTCVTSVEKDKLIIRDSSNPSHKNYKKRSCDLSYEEKGKKKISLDPREIYTVRLL